jgi:hypothetical protein
MQCLPVTKLPDGSNWDYEVKFDGYRALGIKSGGHVRLMSRNKNDLAARFPILTRALANLPDYIVDHSSDSPACPHRRPRPAFWHVHAIGLAPFAIPTARVAAGPGHSPRTGPNILRPRMKAPNPSTERRAKASSTPSEPPPSPCIARNALVPKNHRCNSIPHLPSGSSTLCSGPAPNPCVPFVLGGRSGSSKPRLRCSRSAHCRWRRRRTCFG